ncbi:Ig-like domain repeat protein [Nocardioides sp. Bht2]|uniref:Ig-like domain repeat protein n=1 Tax=Nocardioides sp. Bht2 TaxID=3392297 RepID=UPI0039B44F12
MRTKSTLAGLVGLAVGGALVAAPTAQADRVVPNSQAGDVHVFGVSGATAPFTPVTEEYLGQSLVSVTGRTDVNRYAIDRNGTLLRVKSNGAATHDIPPALAGQEVVSVDAANFHVGAVTAAGVPYAWGTARNLTYANLPTTAAELGGKAVEIVVGSNLVAVRLDNGKVGVLTSVGYSVLSAFENVAEIDAAGTALVVRFEGGGVASWTAANGVIQPPASIAGDQLADPVADFEVGAEAVAVTASGTVVTWLPVTGDLAVNQYPGGVTGRVVDVASLGWNNYLLARTDTGEMVHWGGSDSSILDALDAGIDELSGNEHLASITGSEKTFQVLVSDPVGPLAVNTAAAITGVAKVGQTLTGVPATFTGTPDAIASKWLVDDVEVPGTTPTTLVLDASMLGKSIKFVSTAVRGAETLDSTSSAVGPVTAQENVVSTTAVAISPATGRYGLARSATVTVAAEGETPTGTVTVKVGGVTKTATLANGTAKIALPKLGAGSHTLTALYPGDGATQASSKTAKVVVSKAATSTKVTSIKVTKKGKKVAVKTKTSFPSGASATGTVKVVIKRGSKTVAKGNAKVNSAGVASFTAKKLTKKGKYTVTVSYTGTSNISASSGKKSFKVK